MAVTLDELRIPKALREDVEQIIAVTDAFCEAHLDAEYVGLCRRLIGKLARKRPSPLARGDLRIWAAAVVYTIGSLNFLFDRTQPPHLTGDQIAGLLGVSKSTITNKSRLIRDALRLDRFDVEFCRRELLEHHPTAWLIQVNGLIVDARRMPAHIQEEARRRGLIPTLPAKA